MFLSKTAVDKGIMDEIYFEKVSLGTKVAFGKV
ncbi:hypothetical protein X925_03290 [Petrotoga sp. 9T1HF07.CasAA.8.2]|nr:hypothetical protein X925_03290 [Petrotoga sp. 9T1HF07.CasAA.8.2]